MLDNVDIGWHIAQGRWMVEQGAIYRHDALNYANLGRAVIDEYPLFQILVYLAYSLGWWGPCLLTALAYVALFVIFFHEARRSGLKTPVLFAASLGFLLLYLSLAFPLRPHIATYLGVAALGTFLLRHRAASGWIEFWPMALLQVAWTNCHSGFVIGPVMVALFGVEVVTRDTLRLRAWPWAALRTWLGAFLFIFLACFLNPFGPERFYPPFFQDQLESIRAYVEEMQPLTGGGAALYHEITVGATVVTVLALIRQQGVSWSFVLGAVLFYAEAQGAKKAWPVFGLFVPLMVLSSGAFAAATPRQNSAWAGSAGLAVLSVLMGAALMSRFDGTSTSLQGLWREYDAGHSELSLKALAWMKAHGIEGRLFHRCEDGGWLQEEGYDHGETFADTGFGKYDEAFIHEVGLSGEREALVPRFLKAYNPDFVVCGDFCFRWPFYLKQAGWRLIFYSPNSSVWARTGTREDLPTVDDRQVMETFRNDLAVNGQPDDLLLLGRNLIALNSLGLGDFAFEELSSLPKDFRRASWYWEAARIICTQEPLLSPAHRTELLRQAADEHDDGLTAEFRAYATEAGGDTDGALRILEAIPSNRLGDHTAELLLKIYLERKRPEALALARRTDCWELRNGHHWQFLAEAEARAGHADAAARAWRKAVFYYPDDGSLMAAAWAFATVYHDDELQQAIEESRNICTQDAASDRKM
jgi:tetratricopeptide (TPR) repeat protein